MDMAGGNRAAATAVPLHTTDPHVWGPPLWDLLFTIAFNAPVSKSSAVANLLAQLEHVLPCVECRQTYSAYRKKMRPLLSLHAHKMKASEWLWTMHDMVNQKLGKPLVSYDKVVQKHLHMGCLANSLSTIGLLCLMSKTASSLHLARFVCTLADLSADCPGMTALSEAFQTEQVNETNVHAVLRRVSLAVHNAFGKAPLADEVYESTYARKGAVSTNGVSRHPL